MKTVLRKIDTGIGILEEAVSIFALSIIIVIVIAQVFLRYVLSSGILWGDEVVQNLLVIMVMFGAPAVSRRLLHTDLRVFLNMMPRMLRIPVKALIGLIGLTFLSMFLFSSTKYAFDAHGMFTTVLKIPMTYVYLILPIGAALMLYEYVKTLPAEFKSK